MLGAMSGKYVHTCIRVQDIDKSVAFYGLLGFERRGQLNFDSAYNVYLGLPDDGDVLELTVNVGREAPYDLGEGYNHMALVADDLDGLLERWPPKGSRPTGLLTRRAGGRSTGSASSPTRTATGSS